MEEQIKPAPVIEDDFSDRAPIMQQQPNSREANFILDHSAFTLGLGNIKRWFDKEHFRSRVSDKDEKVHLNIYIPMNTLHELALKRSVPTIASTRAREALAFIDEMIEKEAEHPSDDVSLGGLAIGSEAVHHAPPQEAKSEHAPSEGVDREHVHTQTVNSDHDVQNKSRETPEDGKKPPKKSKSKRTKSKKPIPKGDLMYSFILEDRSHGFLSWNTCAKYQMRRPLNREFPAYKNYIKSSKHGGNAAQTDEELDEEASIPSSITYLIRSCVSIRNTEVGKSHGAPKHPWILVTEDAASKIWADSFGMDSLNVNEAELLLFEGKDLGRFEVKAPGSDFFSETDIYDPISSPLHKVVNTTSYGYSKLGEENPKPALKGNNGRTGSNGTGKKQNPTKPKTKIEEPNTPALKKENGVILEDFNMINYAPRDSNSGLISSSLMNGLKKNRKSAGSKG